MSRLGSAPARAGGRSATSTSSGSEAAVLFLRVNPDGMKYKQRLERKHGQAKALSILSHRLPADCSSETEGSRSG